MLENILELTDLLSWEDSSNNFLIGLNTTTKLWVYSVISGSTKLNTTSVPSHVWNHVEMLLWSPTNRDDLLTSFDEVKMFVNGVCVG